MHASADLIEKSLEAVAERVGDPAPLVYRRLFDGNPDLQALFLRDHDDSVKGQMFQQVIEAVLDFVGPRGFADGLFATEWVNHQGLGVPGDQFTRFFDVLVETFRDVLGADWTDDFDRAWRTVIDDIGAVIAQRTAPA
ncbi:MAG TPA: globin [Quisquiliibacterium sp.]|nr:globin [Quisquiliibacterium sp.]HQD84122.1 globin [Quisquiliibacterium sp.]HQN12864.1 globin [Quisquiliibacterium sp.]HQP65383.1 globin [Quisquiliibacterium sp.]